ncbi:hypothetical protein DALLNEIH_03711 [Bacillus sp. B01(2024)]
MRNMNPSAVRVIDRLAKEKKMSRQEFLHSQLENFAVFHSESNRETEFKSIIEKNIFVMQQCAETLEAVNKMFQELMGEDLE